MRLITAPLPFPGIVSLQIVVHAGSRNEVEKGRSGFAHFFEHMMFRGTPRYPPDQYEAALQRAGASSNAYTDDDRTVYHTTLTGEDFEMLLEMEADRFQNLSYTEEDFRTEALAVLGEYNKDSAEPLNKLVEVLRDTAFDVHPYKHTTMGFLRDIERMPLMYDYSLQFFDRYYRPEYTTIVAAGDVHTERVEALVESYWGGWKRGSHLLSVPKEPAQSGPREAHITWPSHALPYIAVAQKAPAYCDSSAGSAALDLIAFLGFSESSELYERLVIEEQCVDLLWADNAGHVDPYLFVVTARVKDPGKVEHVRQEVTATLDSFAAVPVEQARLESVKSHLRYRFALGLDSTEAIAATLAHYVALRRTPETINRLYTAYEQVSPEDLLRVARWCFTREGRTVVTLEEAR